MVWIAQSNSKRSSTPSELESIQLKRLVSSEMRSHVARQTKEEAERETVLGKSRTLESARAQAEALQWGGLPRQTDDGGKAVGKGGKKGKDKGGGKGKEAAPAAAAQA